MIFTNNISFFILFSLLLLNNNIVNCKYTEKLRFNENGKFKIAQFTDMHFGEDINEAISSILVERLVLFHEKPDFVAFTGDQVSGYEYPGEKGWYKKHFERCIKPVNDEKVPYAFVMGNHDYEGDLTAPEIVDLDNWYPYSMTEKGPSDISGTTNYHIPIYDKDGKNVEFMMWFFDSQNRECEGKRLWGCVGNDTVNWYLEESERLKSQYGRIIPGIAFVHIPPPEFMDMMNINPINGTKEEHICCPLVNTNLVSSFKKTGNVMALFAGHDHVNDFSVEYTDNIKLYYGRKTGYGCYVSQNLKKGGRMIELDLKTHSFLTYIRNEDGTTEKLDKSHMEQPQNSCEDTELIKEKLYYLNKKDNLYKYKQRG